ncbi:helix-turn-helix transcriptional regulator [Demequina capsici]|uniref:Helix-turn-helix transcriptional regulator n=1 Tax=Demequina capsici TaxID=3075620 RepID=A0AA96FC80_9MICO|nr:helix-turn-helix transcriptional regulator [Demequina sp. OYTSA14]WNM25640.1 helix-turn-helix transcriptional regulator [Demequina sp. OYTSA14]
MTKTVLVVPAPCDRHIEQYEIDTDEAPHWATHATPYQGGSLTDVQTSGDMRRWTLPVGDIEWTVGEQYGPQWAEVEIEQTQVSADGDAPPETWAPTISVDFTSDGPYFERPDDARALARLLMKAADVLEDIQGQPIDEEVNAIHHAIASNLHDCMAEASVSLDALAQATGIGADELDAILAAELSLSLPNLARISLALGIEPSRILAKV